MNIPHIIKMINRLKYLKRVGRLTAGRLIRADLLLLLTPGKYTPDDYQELQTLFDETNSVVRGMRSYLTKKGLAKIKQEKEPEPCFQWDCSNDFKWDT